VSQDPVVFTLAAAERIAATVLTVERGDRNGGGLQFERVFEDSFPNSGFFRVCTFTGAWSKNTVKTVTFKYKATAPNTANASNVFVNIVSSTAPRNCAIAREGTAWFLIAAEC
jgi:hypothetical protein